MKTKKILCFALCFLLVAVSVISSSPHEHYIHSSALETTTVSGNDIETSDEVVHEHNYVENIINAATCTEKGIKEYTCECGDTYTNDIEMIEHSFSDWELIDSENIRTCEICGYSESQEIGIAPVNVEIQSNTQTNAKVYMATKLNGFSANVTYNVYVDGEFYTNKSTDKDSTLLLNIPTNTNIVIDCDVDCENPEYVKQSIVSINGKLTKDSYAFYCIYTYEEPCRHPNVNVEKTDPTYTKTGFEISTCSDCGSTVSYKVIDKLVCNHENTSDKVIKAATESAEGLILTTCDDCKKTLGTSPIDKLEHTHQLYSEVIDPTCKAQGYTLNKCKTCTFWQKTDYVDRLSHEWGDKVVVTVPTCTETGKSTSTCILCGSKKNYTESATGHNYTSIITRESTCTEKGIRTYTCSKCSNSYTEDLDLSSHDYSGNYVVTKEANCTEKGSKTLSCTACNEVLSTVETPALGHVGVWHTTKEATTTAEGERQLICSTCEAVLNTEAIPKIVITPETCSHTNTTQETVEVATCSTPKYVKVTCVDCGTIIRERIATTVYDSNNHTNLVSTVTVIPTYSNAGTREHNCSDCGYKMTETIPMLANCPHEHTSSKLVNGKSYIYCTDCNVTLREAVDQSTCTHQCTQTEVLRQAATPNSVGHVDRVCRMCNAVTESLIIPAYDEYQIDIGNGQTATVYGYYDNEESLEIFNLLNEYRTSLGLNTLTWSSRLDEGSAIRARECSYYFSHTRPNGSKWSTLSPYMGGENLAGGYQSAEEVMRGWKNSTGHNENMVYPTFRSVSIQTFHKLVFYEGTYIPGDFTYHVQNFSYSR